MRTPIKRKKKISEETLQAINVAYIYEEKFSKYKHKPLLKLFNTGKKVTKTNTKRVLGVSQATITNLKKVVESTRRNGISIEDYVQAQFYYFHRWFKTAPKLHQLCTPKAEQRALDYLLLDNDEKNVDISSPVLPKKVEPKKIYAANERNLRLLMNAHSLSETEVLKKFSPAGVFDVQWLKDTGRDDYI